VNAFGLAVGLAVALLATSPRTVRADGFSDCDPSAMEPCDPFGCNDIGGCGSCTATPTSSVGTGLALLAFVAYRLGRKRRAS